jgi:hypothetical protein
MFKKMPHCNQLEAFIPDIDIIKESAVKFDPVKSGEARQIDKIDPDRIDIAERVRFSEKGAGSTADVKQLVAFPEINVPPYYIDLVAVKPIHGAFYKPSERSPVAFLPMSDIFVVIELFDPLYTDPGILVGEPAAAADDKGKTSRLSGQIILGDEQRMSLIASAQVTGNFFLLRHC